MIRKRKLAIVAVGALLLTGVAFGISANNRDGLKSDVTNNRRGGNPEIYAWYSNEQWTCDGTTVSRPVSCISVKTGKVFPDVQCTNASPTDEKPVSSFSPFSGEEGAPTTCEQVLSSLHSQRTYSAFKEDVCTSYPEVCRAVDKGNKKQPLYFSNARKSSEVGVVTTKKGLHVFEYSGSILGTQDAGMVLNSLSYEISNYNPDNLKIGNIKLYDSITTVDSLNQFNCVQEYQKNAKKLLITCSLIQPKKTVFTIKDSRGYVPLYLLFDILKSETSNKVMQFKFTGGVYNGNQTKWNDQTYPIRFSTYNETDYCGLYPERCEITADITVTVNTEKTYAISNTESFEIPYTWQSLAPNNSPYAYLLKDTQDNSNPEGGAYASINLGDLKGAMKGAGFTLNRIRTIDSGMYKIVVCDQSTDIHVPTCGASEVFQITVSPIGKCGTAINNTYSVYPVNNLCASGNDVLFDVWFDPLSLGANGNGTWKWICGKSSGVNGGSYPTEVCSAQSNNSNILYSWEIGSWGICNNNSQTRSVACKTNSGKMGSDSYCTGVKPAVSQSCPGSN